MLSLLMASTVYGVVTSRGATSIKCISGTDKATDTATPCGTNLAATPQLWQRAKPASRAERPSKDAIVLKDRVRSFPAAATFVVGCRRAAAREQYRCCVEPDRYRGLVPVSQCARSAQKKKKGSLRLHKAAMRRGNNIADDIHIWRSLGQCMPY